MLAVTILTTLVVGTHGDFLNSLDGRLNFKCPSRQFINYIYSVHDNGAEDRQFKLGCSPIAVSGDGESCNWQPNYVNDFDKPFAFSCPRGGYIAGIDSIHDNGPEDRRFNFYCCTIPDNHMLDCQNSNFKNEYDQILDFTVPARYVTHGVISDHRNEDEDRIFDFEYCRFVHVSDSDVIVG